MRVSILLGTTVLMMAWSGCGGKSGSGGGSPSDPSQNGDNGNDPNAANGNVAFDAHGSGALQIGLGEVGSLGIKFDGYAAEGANLPNVKQAVDANSPGSLAIGSAASLYLLGQADNVHDCVGTSAGDWTVPQAFFCRVLGYQYDDGSYFGPYTYNTKLADVAQTTATINARDEGFLCLREARETITLTAGGVSMAQQLGCWWGNETGGGGVAFGISDSKVWIRMQSYLAANITLDSDGDVAETEVYSAVGNAGATDLALIHIKSYEVAGSPVKPRVEIAAAGNLNAKFDCGVQVVLDKTTNLMRMRYLLDEASPFDCAAGVVMHTDCFSAAKGTFGQDQTTACDSIEFTMPFLYHTTPSNTAGIPSGAIQLTKAQINAFGQDTDSSLENLTSSRIYDPINSIASLLFSTASTSLPGLVATLDSKSNELKQRYGDSTSACLLDVPTGFSVTDPLNLGMTTMISCINPSEDYENAWDGFGQTNGTAYAVNSEPSLGSMNMFAFNGDGEVEAWLVQGSIADEQSRALNHMRKTADGVEVTGLMPKSALACGYHVRADATHLYARSTFDGNNCGGTVYEICFNQSTADEVALADCQAAGLDIFTLPTLDASAIAHDRFKDLAKPAPGDADDLNATVAQDATPPIAAIPPPADGDGAMDVVPLRSNNVSIARTSGGGINYGRNCRHSSAVGRATMDAQYALELSSLAADKLSTLQSAIASNNAFVALTIGLDTLKIGDGASISHDAAIVIDIVDGAGTTIATRTVSGDAVVDSGYAFFSIFNGLSISGNETIRVTTSGTAVESCASQSGQAHLSLGLSEVKLRF